MALILLAFNVDSVFAEEIGRADQALNSTIANFVTAATNDPSSTLYQFVRSMMIGFTFIGFAWMVMSWATKWITLGELVVYVGSVILIWTFYTTYNASMSTVWGWADDLAVGVQLQAVGNGDVIFIGEKLSEAIGNFFAQDIDIFDGMNAIVAVLIFHLIALILEVVVFIISMWHVWGYAFAKITGLFFVPLMLVPITRGFFQSWLQIFLGFWFFNFFAKVALAIYYLYFFAIFGPVDTPVELSPLADGMSMGRIMLHFLIGIFFLLSTGGLAAMMASGFSGVAGRMSSGLSNIAALATKALA